MEALNEKVRLPKLLVVIPDNKLFEAFNTKDECRKMVSLFIEMYRAIETIKDQLPAKAFNMGEPKIIWVKVQPVQNLLDVASQREAHSEQVH